VLLLKGIMLAILFGAMLVLAACSGEKGSDSSSNSGTSDTVNVSAAEKIYNQKCSNCHGGDLRGGVGPDLTKIGGNLSQKEIEQVIANGQGAMPKGLIEGEEATAVAEWLAAKK
jgi:cytochrome c551